MRTLEQQFASRLSAFLRRTGLRPTTFGRMALGDPNLVRQIDGGRSLTLKTADRVLAFMAEYDGDSGGARDRPRRHRHRTAGSRTRRTRSSRATTEQPGEQRTNPPTRFLRLPEVQARTGLSRGMIYVRLDQGRFPRPVSLGARAVGWIEAEVDEWIRERIEASRSVAGGAVHRPPGGRTRRSFSSPTSRPAGRRAREEKR